MTSAKRTYHLRLFGLLGLYILLLFPSLMVTRSHPHASWRYLVALLPVLPLLPIPWAALVFIRSMDELQRRIHLESFAFAFVATALTTFTYGLLQNVGLPDVNWMFVWPVLATFWVLGLLIARRKYA